MQTNRYNNGCDFAQFKKKTKATKDNVDQCQLIGT